MNTSEIKNSSTELSDTTRIPSFFRRWISAYVAQYEPLARRADNVDASTLLPPMA